PVAVVVNSLDRFGRRLMERLRVREELKALGVPTHSVRDNGEVSNVVADIMGSIAEEEARLASVRTRETRCSTVGKGWAPGGRIPFGYTRREASPEERSRGAPSSVLEPDPVTRPLAVEMFERAANGATVRSMARWLASLPAELRQG